MFGSMKQVLTTSNARECFVSEVEEDEAKEEKKKRRRWEEEQKSDKEHR